MKKHKTVVLLGILGALFLGVSSGSVYVAHTVAAYSGVCSKLDGFPGLLQSAGFVPFGDCKLVRGECPGPTKELCKVAGKKGHCVVDVVDGKKACVCVPIRISR